MDKTGRNGLRVGDTESPEFNSYYHALVDKHKHLLEFYQYKCDIEAAEKEWMEGISLIRSLPLTDSEYTINSYMQSGKTILAEGAQGSLLDIDFGSYPFVTSSNTVTAGTCTGLGIAPSRIGEVYGIFKAYCTRVGSGPFPTELENETGELIRKKGNEFGATTGRPRRCGWLDLPALKYAIMLNGVTRLIMTKPDVLNGFEKLKVCTGYLDRGKKTDRMPFDIAHHPVEPIYEEMDGWTCDFDSISIAEELPATMKNYIGYLEKALEVPVVIVSVGPDRKQTIICKPFKVR